MLKSMKSFRFWSLVLGVTSIMPLAYFMYQNWLFSQWAKEEVSNGGFVCGTGMFALLALCVVVAGAFSGIASLFALVGYLKAEKPRPRMRLLEIMLVGSVMIIAVTAGFLFI